MDMCRYYSANDPGYKQVGGELQSLVLEVEVCIRKQEKELQHAQKRECQFFQCPVLC